MAKKKESVSLSDILGEIKNIDVYGSTGVLSDDDNAYITDYIPTGNYALNAIISGSIYKGIPCGRITQLSGDSGTGKTFIALNACREAQKKGYFVIYFDTEGATDREQIERMGVDPSRMKLIDSNNITMINQILMNILDKCERGNSEEKFIFVIDSVGGLVTSATEEKVSAGSTTRDMTKQQDIKKLFVTISSRLKRVNFPMIITNHVYATMNPYGEAKKTSGGTGTEFMPSITLRLSKAQLKEDGKDKEKTGIVVTCVLEKARYTKASMKIKFHISFRRGMNKYVFLENFVDYDICGIGQGSMKEGTEMVEGKGGKMKAVPNGIFTYEKTTTKEPSASTPFAVKHLGTTVPFGKLYTGEVFTEEVLRIMDEKIIKPMLEFPKYDDDLQILDEVTSDLFDEDNEE